MDRKAKICVISDSHGSWTNIQSLLIDNYYTHIFFLGDGIRDITFSDDDRLTMVEGNGDYFSNYALQEEMVINGVRIMLTHGHLYNVKYGLYSLISEGHRQKANIVCYGHTHSQHIEQSDDMIILNPGSISAGRYAEITIETNGKILCELKSL